jgi:hypothetical protein
VRVRLLCGVDSRGLIELRFPDGDTVRLDYEQFTSAQLGRGDQLEYEGRSWVMRDREDRAGVTVYVLTPAESDDSPGSDRTRARSRRPSLPR